MPSRRTHRKSRFGCSECKFRKVKCDEARPSCSYCLRGGGNCVYPIIHFSTSISQAASSTPGGSRPLSPLEHQYAADQLTFDLMDLTLINHFTAVTSQGMFLGKEQQKLWQKDIPFEARSYPLLMHGLLSIASLHLALFEPEKLPVYRLRALYHHDLGLKLFNDQLSHVSSGNSHIMFAFALMLVIWAYASAAVGKDDLGLDDILNLLDLVRGCRTIFLLQRDTILDKPVGAFIALRQWPDSSKPNLSPTIYQAFQNLRARAEDSTYIAAIEKLETLLRNSMVRSNDTTIALAWPALVEDSFWNHLRKHETLAILIFAHFSMLIQRYENNYWWMAGWSERIIKAAENALSNIDKDSLDWDICLNYIRSHDQRLAPW